MADLIPVIRGKMGGRDYYIGKMTFQELDSKVQFYADLDASPDLDQLLQRGLSRRAEEMTNYLLKQPERFYGAIIVAAWGGKPGYIKVKMEDHPLLDDDFEFGLLKFDGRQEYFALDGQHRLKSIEEAIRIDPSLRHEEVSVIFLTHERTEEGNIKTRRLFHTLNRYAKPTTTGENIALDEDNVVSIATRQLLTAGIKLLHSKSLELVRKNLTKTQDDKFTSLAALWDFNYAVLDSIYGYDKDYLRFRPDVSHVENTYNALASLWMEVRDKFDVLRDIEDETRSPGELREPDGDPALGHLLVRPVGLRIYGTILSSAIADEMEGQLPRGSEFDPRVWRKVLKRVEPLPMVVGEIPWRGTVFRNNRMETGARGLAVRLSLYMLGFSNVEEDKLRDDYRGHLEDQSANLPPQL